MKKRTVFATLFILLVIMACNKKNDSPVNNNPSKTEILTSGTWKLTAWIYDDDGNGSYESDFFVLLPSCFTDNYYTFKNNGQVETNENTSKCDPADPQTVTTPWQFTQTETRLVMDGDEYIIDALTNTTLRIKDDMATYGSMITFTKR